MKNKFITIKLRFDLSTIDFGYFEKTIETIIGFTETYSFAQLNNYKFFIMGKKIDEKKPESQTIDTKNRNLLFDETIAPPNEPSTPLEIPFEIKMIATAPFFHVSKLN